MVFNGLKYLFFFPIVITREGKILIAENVWFSSLLWGGKKKPASGKSALTKCPEKQLSGPQAGRRGEMDLWVIKWP